MKTFFLALTLILSWTVTLAAETVFLRENLKNATPGDFIVTSQNKAYTLLHIYSKTAQTLTLEEITVPEKKRRNQDISWRDWVKEGAPGNTSWVMYEIDLPTGKMGHYFSFSRNAWYDMPEADNFLSTLLNLRMTKIDESKRKRVGPPPSSPLHEWRLWQPCLVVDGQPIEGVQFDGWFTIWPNDGTELAGKSIEVYLPKKNEPYPSYFPYWLQISGKFGKAKVRIIDSGTGLKSPKPALSQLQ